MSMSLHGVMYPCVLPVDVFVLGAEWKIGSFGVWVNVWVRLLLSGETVGR